MFLKNYQDIKKISQEIFGVFILDIEEDPLEWITKDLYYKFIKQIFNTKTSDEKLYAVILNYNDINLSVTSYKDKFNLLILIWLLGFSPDGKMNKNQKRKLITKSKKYLTEEPSLRNEYINDEHLDTFIRENSFIFSPVELRHNFYSKYINSDLGPAPIN